MIEKPRLMKHILVTLLLLFSITATAQKQLILLSREKLNATSPIVSGFFNENGEFIGVYKKFLGMKTIAKGQYAGFPYGDMKVGLVLPDGKEMKFEERESYLGSFGNKVLTEWSDGENVDVRAYELKADGRILHNNIAFKNVDGPIYQMGRFVFTSNCSEGYGTYLNIYDLNLQLLSNYSFEEGYERCWTGISKSAIAAVFKTRNGIKLVTFNLDNGKIIKDCFLNVPKETDPNKITVLENQVILYQYQKLLCFDLSGNPLWSKDELKSPWLDMFASGKNFYFFSHEHIICIESGSGKEAWRMKLSDITGKSGEEKKEWIRVWFPQKTDEDEIGFVISNTRYKDQNGDSLIKTNSRFLLFDPSGKKVIETSVDDNYCFFAFKKNKDEVILYTDREKLKYKMN